MNNAAPPRPSLFRFLPIAIIAAAAAAVFASGAYKLISFETLRTHQAGLETFVSEHYFAAIAVYGLIYIAATALSLPGGLVMSLVGGFLFGALAGTGIVVVSATIGACIIFAAAKSAFGDALRKKAGPFVKKMEDGFRDNAFSFLLLLRLIPVFPFVVVNIAPALFNVRLATYALATFVGIIPGTFAYVSAGAGLGAALESGGEVELSGILLKPEVITPILALSVLAVLPIILKRFGIDPLQRKGKA
ncbi:MAG: TVP38/TMEM64 family protein [Parvularculaceae bacterium]